ncbi:hypothetical protein SCB49_01257 [unidentified eubacterium SCB49]|nr:hypothetical protein SCB49_01257 [unidentified eubacterium SCB49]
MRFSHINNVTIIAVVSIVLAILEHVFDLDLGVQKEEMNVFELLMMTAIIFTILCSLYIIGSIIHKWISKLRRVKS